MKRSSSRSIWRCAEVAEPTFSFDDASSTQMPWTALHNVLARSSALAESPARTNGARQRPTSAKIAWVCGR